MNFTIRSVLMLVPEGCQWSVGSATHGEFVASVGGLVAFADSPTLALSKAAAQAIEARERQDAKRLDPKDESAVP